MVTFDFITHDDFRASLESDYSELKAAMDGQAYKAVHVLAGSIVEAVLADYLIAIDYQSRTGKDPLRMSLDELIKSCVSERIISSRVADLSTVIRSYRNLIHPARMVREKERVDENGAKVAQTLVDMIVDEIATQKRKTYGYTAKQIIEKVDRDASVYPILEDILQKTRAVELEKLLDLIPVKYAEPLPDHTTFDEDYEYRKRFEYCFRMVLNLISIESKHRHALKFADIIKQGSEREVRTYGDAFFQALDMHFLGEEDVTLVKKHIIHRLEDVIQSGSSLANGIGQFLSKDDVNLFTDTVIKTHPTTEEDSVAVDFLLREYFNMNGELQEAVKNRLQAVVNLYLERRRSYFVDNAKAALDRITDEELPF